MPIHAHRQGFEALQHHERIERAHRLTQRAQRFAASLHRETEIAERLVKANAVITRRRFDHARKIAVVPVELAGLDHDPAHARAMSADKLGRRVHDDIGAVVDGFAQIRRSKGIVDDQRNAGIVRNRRYASISITLLVGLPIVSAYSARVLLGNRAAKILRVVGIDKRGVDPHFSKRHIKLRKSAAVKSLGRDELVALLHQRQNCAHLRSHAGTDAECGATVLQRGHPLFKHAVVGLVMRT